MNFVEVTGPATHTSAQAEAAGWAVTANNLTKLFGRFAALRNITAQFASARMYALLGDNGAGKSTLLRVIAGLARPSYGTVSVFGAARPREFASLIGYMAHAPLLYDELTAMENLVYFARLYGISSPDACEAAIATVGLNPGLKRRVGQYSQGMRQRLSLARALLHDPQLLLLDEPFSNVDAVSAARMVEVLAQMRNRGKTIFVVTHQPALLQGAADESVIMEAGQIALRSEGVPPSPSAALSGRPL